MAGEYVFQAWHVRDQEPEWVDVGDQWDVVVVTRTDLDGTMDLSEDSLIAFYSCFDMFQVAGDYDAPAKRLIDGLPRQRHSGVVDFLFRKWQDNRYSYNPGRQS